jgi:hypothetical protein
VVLEKGDFHCPQNYAIVGLPKKLRFGEGCVLLLEV